LNTVRRSAISQVFSLLDRANIDLVNTAVIKSSFNPSNNPDVRSGKRSEEDVNVEFRSSFESYLDLRVKLNSFLQQKCNNFLHLLGYQ
jgi:hypothetical protein